MNTGVAPGDVWKQFLLH